MLTVVKQTLLRCIRLTYLRKPIDAWFREHPEYAAPLEISHWDYLLKLKPVFSALKTCSKRLEADDYVTGSKALKMLSKLLYYLRATCDQPCKGPATALVPLTKDMLQKLTEGLDDPTWVWQLTFLSLMDPSGEYSMILECTCRVTKEPCEYEGCCFSVALIGCLLCVQCTIFQAS